MAYGTTVDDVVQRIRRDALLASRGPVYTVSAPYTAGQTTIETNEAFTHVGVGSLLSIDYELFLVQSASAGTKTITVVPGYFGTTQANHSTNAIIEVDPRWPQCTVRDFMLQEILSWGKELFRVTSADVATLSGDRAYDLGATGEVYFLLDARAHPPDGGGTSWWNWSWTGNAWPRVNARLIRGADTATFPSGLALQVKHPTPRSGTIRVAYAQPFNTSTFEAATDLVATVGLKTEWIDVVEWGARVKLLHSATVGRTDWRRGSMSRESEEVSVFDVMRAADHARQMRDIRFAKAAVDLRGDWPYREVG